MKINSCILFKLLLNINKFSFSGKAKLVTFTFVPFSGKNVANTELKPAPMLPREYPKMSPPNKLAVIRAMARYNVFDLLKDDFV